MKVTTKITLEIQGQELSLSYEEANSLYAELKKIFDKNLVTYPPGVRRNDGIVDIKYPIIVRDTTAPLCDPPTIWCSTTDQ